MKTDKPDDTMQPETETEPVTKPTDPSQKMWDDLFTKLRLSALPDVQKTAGSWGTSLGTLLGVFGIASFIKGRSDLNELAEWTRYAVGAVTAAALLAYAFAIWKAAIAGQGIPRHFGIHGTRPEDNYDTMVDGAISNLNASRVSGVIAVLLILTATGLLWFGPPADKAEASTTYIVQSHSGSVLCGKLLTSPETGSVTLQPQPKPQPTASVGKGENTPTPLPTATLAPTVGLTDVVSMTTVSTCP